jgi:hypothetical protein
MTAVQSPDLLEGPHNGTHGVKRTFPTTAGLQVHFPRH